MARISTFVDPQEPHLGSILLIIRCVSTLGAGGRSPFWFDSLALKKAESGLCSPPPLWWVVEYVAGLQRPAVIYLDQ